MIRTLRSFIPLFASFALLGASLATADTIALTFNGAGPTVPSGLVTLTNGGTLNIQGIGLTNLVNQNSGGTYSASGQTLSLNGFVESNPTGDFYSTTGSGGFGYVFLSAAGSSLATTGGLSGGAFGNSGATYVLQFNSSSTATSGTISGTFSLAYVTLGCGSFLGSYYCATNTSLPVSFSAVSGPAATALQIQSAPLTGGTLTLGFTGSVVVSGGVITGINFTGLSNPALTGLQGASSITPEPSSWVAVGGGLFALLALRRKVSGLRG